MFAYRHAFHAGNHADVLKHFVLQQILAYASQKTTPFWYIDTHAGAGFYALDEAPAMTNQEFNTGIGRLLAPVLSGEMPDALQPYLDLVRQCQSAADAPLRVYPGSAGLAYKMLRPEHRLHLCERHPSEIAALQQQFASTAAMRRRVTLHPSDGYAALKALLPPPLPTRRAVVLIDPPYEDKADYARVIAALNLALARFPTGTYALWYPLVNRLELPKLQQDLARLNAPSWLKVQLWIDAPKSGFGLFGSGLYVINPPWTLPATLKTVMPWLTQTLAQTSEARHELGYFIP